MNHLHPSRTPRILLVVTAFGLIAVGVQTLRYDSAFLRVPWLWAALTFAAGSACLVAVVYPLRRVVAMSGSAVVVACVARSAAIWTEVFIDPPSGASLAAFEIAATTWAVMGLWGWALWKHIVTPWAVICRVHYHAPHHTQPQQVTTK